MTYEYVCTACAHQWEAEQPISAPPLKTCPECGRDFAKRQISGGAGFILKGGGWYADGYGPAKPKAAGAGAAGKKIGTKTNTESKTESTHDSGAKGAEGSKATSSTQAV